jgi:dolichol-phosphate mannosyltransferase
MQHGTIMGTTCAILMPAYNEEEALPEVLRDWSAAARSIGGTLIVLNDGSRDHTLDVLMSALAEYDNLVVLDKPNSGHGPTCLVGYGWAAEQGFEWVFQTDSDGQTQSDEFLRTWKLRDHAPFVFGYRPKRGDGWIRYMISRSLRIAVLLTLGVYVRDANVPFRIMRVDKLWPFVKAVPKNFFLANALLAAVIQKYGEGIYWTPITFLPRTGGTPSVQIGRFASIGIRVIGDFRAIRRELKRRFGNDVV